MEQTLIEILLSGAVPQKVAPLCRATGSEPGPVAGSGRANLFSRRPHLFVSSTATGRMRS